MTSKDVVLAVLIPLALAEFGPWCGWLAARVLGLAAMLRYGRGDHAALRAEEWATGDLSEIPGQLTKLVYSLGQLLVGSAAAAARKISGTGTPGLALSTATAASPGQDPPWMDRALCASFGTEAFFPDRGGSTQAAKSVCSACPVRAECLEYALDNDEQSGVWGGLSERERRSLKRRASIS